MRLCRKKKSDPSSQDSAEQSGQEDARMSARLLSQVLEAGSRVQAPAIKSYVAKMRRDNPNATPADIITKLEKRYLAAVMASGAAVGSAAAFPGIGTLTALSAVAGETVVFLEATVLYVLAVAEVHGIPLEERERRRALVLGVLVGAESKGEIRALLGSARTSGAWLAEAEMLPLPVVSQLNSRLTQYFVKKYTMKRAAMAFGKLLPVGIGAAVGGGGNRIMGKKIVANAREAFGPSPTRWPVTLHLVSGTEGAVAALPSAEEA